MAFFQSLILKGFELRGSVLWQSIQMIWKYSKKRVVGGLLALGVFGADSAFASSCSSFHRVAFELKQITGTMLKNTEARLGPIEPRHLRSIASEITLAIQAAVRRPIINNLSLLQDLAKLADQVDVPVISIPIPAHRLLDVPPNTNPAETTNVIQYLNRYSRGRKESMAPAFSTPSCEIKIIEFTLLGELDIRLRRKFLLEELGTIVEEFGHLVQYLRGRADQQPLISEFFKSAKHRRQFLDFLAGRGDARIDSQRTQWLEADIYAFSLETLGAANVPQYVGDNYASRKFVDLHLR